MCNPSFSDSLAPPSPSSSSSSSIKYYYNNRRPITRKPSLRSMPKVPLFSYDSDGGDDERRPVYFLDSCFLCKTPLHLGDDIYMYRGDTPFCSEDCREDQIQIDETREKNESIERNKKILMRSKTPDSRSHGAHLRIAGAVLA